MEKLKIYKALEKAIDSIEDAIVTLYEAPTHVEFMKRQESIQMLLEDVWCECRSLMKKLNPPF